jgi:hypothetical protein
LLNRLNTYPTLSQAPVTPNWLSIEPNSATKMPEDAKPFNALATHRKLLLNL